MTTFCSTRPETFETLSGDLRTELLELLGLEEAPENPIPAEDLQAKYQEFVEKTLGYMPEIAGFIPSETPSAIFLILAALRKAQAEKKKAEEKQAEEAELTEREVKLLEKIAYNLAIGNGQSGPLFKEKFETALERHLPEALRPHLETLHAIRMKAAAYAPAGGDPAVRKKLFLADGRSEEDFEPGSTNLINGGKTMGLQLALEAVRKIEKDDKNGVFFWDEPVQHIDFEFLGLDPELFNTFQKKKKHIDLLVGKKEIRTLIIPNEISLKEKDYFLSLVREHNIILVEINGDEYKYSFAKVAEEEGLSENILRISSAAEIDGTYEGTSLAFLQGNPRLVKLIQTLHTRFQGTPSVPETELINHPEILEALKEIDIKETRARLEENIAEYFEMETKQTMWVNGSARNGMTLHRAAWEQINGRKMKVGTWDGAWTYDNIYDDVCMAPNKENKDGTFTFPAESLIEQAETENWDAIIINDPNNATGQRIPIKEKEKIIHWAMKKGVLIIENNAYRDMDYSEGYEMGSQKSMIQIAEELGYKGDDLKKISLIQAFSKTNMEPGSRSAVAEIMDMKIFHLMQDFDDSIEPNRLAIVMQDAFWKQTSEEITAFFEYRNQNARDRIAGIKTGMEKVPHNPYEIKIVPPAGALYPMLYVTKLPEGINMDEICFSLTEQELIAMTPGSNFFQTESNSELARTSARLTIGGTYAPEDYEKMVPLIVEKITKFIDKKK